MTWSLVFGCRGLSDLRSRLLEQAPNEAGAVLFCNSGGHKRLLIDSVQIAERKDLSVQAPAKLELAPDFLSRVIKRARGAQQTIIFVHTHPFSDVPQFSLVDDDCERALMPAVQMRASKLPHGSLVLGTTGFEGRVYEGSSQEPITRILEVGEAIHETNVSRFRELIADAYDRNVRAFGEAGQERLRKLKVAIVGAGGTGSLVSEQLAHLGVGQIVLIDDDLLSTTNLNRVVGASPREVGAPKVSIAAEHIKRISGGAVRAVGIKGNILDERAGRELLTCDAVFSCTDTHGSRALVNQIAYQYMIPTFDMGVRIDAHDGRVMAMAGRAQMLAPGLACLQCQSLLDPEQVRRDLMTEAARQADPYIVGEATPQPAIISINGVVASLAVTMFLAAFTGMPVASRRLNYRIGESSVRPVKSTTVQDCIVCSSTQGALGKGDVWPLFWRLK